MFINFRIKLQNHKFTLKSSFKKHNTTFLNTNKNHNL